jgi:cell division septum initiation protein DivIVA
MPIRPEDIDPGKLPTSLRGYDRDATDELLKRVAWDYRQALRAQDDRGTNEDRHASEIRDLEARIALQQEEFTRAISAREARVDTDLGRREAALEEELAQLRRKVHAYESRDELMRALLLAAQRAAREMRESAREDAEALLKAARRRAVGIERNAYSSARHSAVEVERLRRLENDLRDRLRSTLEAVIGSNGTEPAPAAEAPQAEPSTDSID